MRVMVTALSQGNAETASTGTWLFSFREPMKELPGKKCCSWFRSLRKARRE